MSNPNQERKCALCRRPFAVGRTPPKFPVSEMTLREAWEVFKDTWGVMFFIGMLLLIVVGVSWGIRATIEPDMRWWLTWGFYAAIGVMSLFMLGDVMRDFGITFVGLSEAWEGAGWLKRLMTLAALAMFGLGLAYVPMATWIAATPVGVVWSAIDQWRRRKIWAWECEQDGAADTEEWDDASEVDYWEDTTMPSREDDAAANLRRAIRDASGEFVVERVTRGVDGYSVVFRKGHFEHAESQIDEAVLEDGPATDAIKRLVHKVKSVFGEM